jgi:hypothetical protein
VSVALRRSWPWLAIVCALGLIFGRSLASYFEHIFDPTRFNDDARIQLYYFYHYRDPALFAADVIGKYHSDGTADFFRALYFVTAKVGDPLVVSRFLPLPLLLVTLAGVAVAARNLAGSAGVFVALALCLSAGLIHDRIAGGLPRSFAFPLVAWSAAALTVGSARGVAVLTAVGMGFYPVVGVIGGIALAILLLVVPRPDGGEASTWPLKKRLVLLALTGASTLVVLPFALRMKPYGETIKPEMTERFPETGPGGRQSPRDRLVRIPFFDEAARVARDSTLSRGEPLVAALNVVPGRKHSAVWFGVPLALLMVAGLFRAGLRSPPLRRLAALALASVIGYELASAVTPTLVLAQRYAMYSIPILLPLAVAAGFRGLFPRRLPEASASGLQAALPAVWTLLLGAILLVLAGGQGTSRDPLGVRLTREDAPVYAAIRNLSKDALVAGWPRGLMDQVAIASLRTPFLTYQTHMPYHTGMTLLMRARMRALITAYFATDPAPIRRLRDEHGVTHLLVEWSHLTGSPPDYFEPFDRDIARALKKSEGKSYELSEQANVASVFDDGRYGLVDLRRVR